jgi:hypothetical protein
VDNFVLILERAPAERIRRTEADVAPTQPNGYFPSYYTAVKSTAPDRHREHRDKRQPLMLNTGQSIPAEQVSDDPRRRSRRGLPLPCHVAYFSGYKYTPPEDGEGFSR